MRSNEYKVCKLSYLHAGDFVALYVDDVLEFFGTKYSEAFLCKLEGFELGLRYAGYDFLNEVKSASQEWKAKICAGQTPPKKLGEVTA